MRKTAVGGLPRRYICQLGLELTLDLLAGNDPPNRHARLPLMVFRTQYKTRTYQDLRFCTLNKSQLSVSPRVNRLG